MIEALARLLVEVFGQVMVQGLGWLLLRPLHPRGDPSEIACTVTGFLGWIVLGCVAAIAWTARD